MLHVEAPVPAAGHELLVQRDGHRRRRGLGKAGAAALQVGVQRELRHHQQLASGGGQVQVHFARLIGKDPQATDLIGHFVGQRLRILWADAQQDQKALADLSYRLPFDGHRSGGDSCHDCPHSKSYPPCVDFSDHPSYD